MTCLRAATLVYLGLPQLVFLATWIRPLYGWPTIVLLVVGLARASRRPPSDGPSSAGDVTARSSARHLLIACLPAIAVGLVCGAGGWGYQDADWLKHDAILRDLVHETWPVVYHYGEHPLVLTYYVAYYLPAALVGKVAGWSAANHALALYTIAGLCLASMWVVRLTGLRQWWVVPLFLAFSGMDVIGQSLLTLDQAFEIGLLPPGGGWKHIEWWAGTRFAQYSGMSTLIMFVPNQAIAGWLLTAMVVADARDHRSCQTAALYLGISVLWSPFVTLGLGPFVLAGMALAARRSAPGGNIVARSLTVANLAGAIIGLLAVTYLFARFEAHRLPIDVAGLDSAHLSVQSGNLLPAYPLFIFLEFALLHVLLHLYLALPAAHKPWPLRALLAVASATLVALPFIRYGFYNDLVMRVSIPALFLTVLAALVVIGDTHGRARSSVARRLQRAVLAVLLVGSVTPAIEIARHLWNIYQRDRLVAVAAAEEVMSLMQLQQERYHESYNFVGQYVGSSTSLFMTYLAKTSAMAEPMPETE